MTRTCFGLFIVTFLCNKTSVEQTAAVSVLRRLCLPSSMFHPPAETPDLERVGSSHNEWSNCGSLGQVWKAEDVTKPTLGRGSRWIRLQNKSPNICAHVATDLPFLPGLITQWKLLLGPRVVHTGHYATRCEFILFYFESGDRKLCTYSGDFVTNFMDNTVFGFPADWLLSCIKGGWFKGFTY